MRNFIRATVAALLVIGPVRVAAAETTPLRFVDFFITALSDFENIRTKATAEAPGDLAACVRNTEAWNLQLAGDINLLSSMTLSSGADTRDVPQLFAKNFEIKRGIIAELGALCTTMAEGPKSGVDYPALMANAPKLTARIDYIDKITFDGSMLVFSTLISDVPDAENHMSHLVITRAERDKLVATIDADFGNRLNAPNALYNVAIASIFRQKLLEFKCSDE